MRLHSPFHRCAANRASLKIGWKECSHRCNILNTDAIYLSFFQVPKSALATFEAATAISASVMRKAERTDAVAAFVANIPFAGAWKFFAATLAGDIDQSITI